MDPFAEGSRERRPRSRRAGLLVAVVLAATLIGVLLTSPACSTYSERLEHYREALARGDLITAREEIDELISDESGVDYDEIVASRGTEGATIPLDAGETWLLLLEKTSYLIARGKLAEAIVWLRRVRDHMDTLLSDSVEDYFGEVMQAIRDDTVRTYRGADYEHVLTRALLAVLSLVAADGDAYAYALQIGEMQERIIDSPFGENQGYSPRERYRRVAFGAYLQGMIQELHLAGDEALKAYERARDYAGENPLIEEAIARVKERVYADAGEGVLFVFYLAGQGPILAETTSPPTELASRLAGIGITIAAGTPSALVQVAVPVPEVLWVDPNPPSIIVQASGREAHTQTILDVNRIAVEQHEANLPWTIARAIVRRSLKAAAAAAVEYGVREAARDDRRRGANAAAALAGFLAGVLTNLTLTATESADTRLWSSLPAEVQIARLPLPAGVHHVVLGDGSEVEVRITAGYDSYVLLQRPSLARPGHAIVDRYSTVEAAEPVKPPLDPPASDAVPPLPSETGEVDGASGFEGVCVIPGSPTPPGFAVSDSLDRSAKPASTAPRTRQASPARPALQLDRFALTRRSPR